MKTLILILIALFCISLISSSQNRKALKERGILSKTEWMYDYKYGKEKKYKETVEKYDANGNETEMINYDEFGKITNHVKTEYNDDGEIIKEIYYTPTGSIEKTIVYKFEGPLKTEKLVYDGNKNLKSKKVYEYSKNK